MTGGERLGSHRLAGAAAWRLAYLGIEGGSSVAIFAGLAHILHRDQFAAAGIAQGVVVIAQTLGDFGLSQTAVAFLPARVAAEPGGAVELRAGAARTYLFAGLVAALVTAISAAAVPHHALGAVLAIAPAAAATVITSGADGLLRSQGEFRRPVLLVAASRAGMFAAVPFAAISGSAVWACLALSAGTWIGATGALRVLIGLRRPSPRAPMAGYIRAAIPLGVSQLFVAIGTRFDTILAGAITGLIAAGTFEGGWRCYQLTQYAVGWIPTASAPFLSDAFGRGRYDEVMRLTRRLGGTLLAAGAAAGAILYLARHLIARVFAGSLAGPVAHTLPVVALLSPLALLGLLAYYGLAGRDETRSYVLVANGIGALVNVAAVMLLAPSHGARGVMEGCAIGVALTNVLLLGRFAAVLRSTL